MPIQLFCQTCIGDCTCMCKSLYIGLLPATCFDRAPKQKTKMAFICSIVFANYTFHSLVPWSAITLETLATKRRK